MTRKLLVVSLVLLVAGLGLFIYADPLARLTFSGARSTFPITNGTGTFTFTGGNFTIPSGTFTGVRGATGAAGVGGSTESIETLVGIALFAVGLVLEALTILIWNGEHAIAGPSESTVTDGKQV